MSLPPANENVYRTTPPRYQPSLEEIINVRRITYKLTHPEIPYVAPHAPQSSPVDKLVGGAALQSMMDLSKSNDRTIGFICGVFWLTVLGLFASKIILQRYKFRAE